MMLQRYHNDRFFGRRIFLAIIAMTSQDTVLPSFENRCVMPVTKMITTFASVTVGACGLFAFSWVGLALLGF
jgi:hypothetical protein